MLDSKTLNDLVGIYQAAKQTGDTTTINSAEAALVSFSQAEAAIVSVRVSEAVAVANTKFFGQNK